MVLDASTEVILQIGMLGVMTGFEYTSFVSFWPVKFSRRLGASHCYRDGESGLSPQAKHETGSFVSSARFFIGQTLTIYLHVLPST
jgi:hypothetical protein